MLKVLVPMAILKLLTILQSTVRLKCSNKLARKPQCLLDSQPHHLKLLQPILLEIQEEWLLSSILNKEIGISSEIILLYSGLEIP